MSQSRDNRPYDLAIVGASFAGLVCARTAAMRGLKVCVLEAKDDPGARIHTTGILVKEAADEVDLPHALMRRVHGVRLYAPNLTSVDLFAPGQLLPHHPHRRSGALARRRGAAGRRPHLLRRKV